MKYLKRSSFIFYLLFLGCATSSYQIRNQSGGLVEIAVSPDRVQLECEFITGYSGDLDRPYGFMIHVLDEENTVMTISQGHVLEKEVCMNGYYAIEKILKSGNTIFIGGFGELIQPREKNEPKYLFPGLGKYPDNGHHLQYLVLWNDKGQCYDAYMGNEKPCPRGEFPLRTVSSP